MWLADQWNDYEVIDCSKGEKLERWGDYLLVRPDPQVIWDTPKKENGWRKMNGHYHRSSKGGGEWEFFQLPKEWTIQYSLPINKKLTFHLKPFSFKHTGLFPEQAANWNWFSQLIADAVSKGRQVKVLNLFAYTGGATLAAAAAGASVTHVDASKGMVTWAKENAISSGLKLFFLFCEDRKLCDISKSFLIRFCSMEISSYNILHRRCYFTFIGVIFLSAFSSDN